MHVLIELKRNEHKNFIYSPTRSYVKYYEDIFAELTELEDDLHVSKQTKHVALSYVTRYLHDF